MLISGLPLVAPRAEQQDASGFSFWRTLGLYRTQESIIFPGQRTQGRPEASFEEPTGAQFVRIRTADNERITGVFVRAKSEPASAATAPTLLFFYGNDMCLRTACQTLAPLSDLGANLFIPEYVGYGLSDGRASEHKCYATATAAYEYLLNRNDIDRSRIFGGGVSLGGAVAIDLASRRPLAGLITLLTFSSLIDMARHHFPALRARWLLRHRFESERKMPKVTCPALLIHSRGDRLAPHTMCDRLAAACGGPVTRFDLDHADHNSRDMLANSQPMLETMRRFLKTSPASH